MTLEFNFDLRLRSWGPSGGSQVNPRGRDMIDGRGETKKQTLMSILFAVVREMSGGLTLNAPRTATSDRVTSSGEFRASEQSSSTRA